MPNHERFNRQLTNPDRHKKSPLEKSEQRLDIDHPVHGGWLVRIRIAYLSFIQRLASTSKFS
ncbi:MAG: hypothetical protein ACXWT0_08180, partial [Methylobacter sp.]